MMKMHGRVTRAQSGVNCCISLETAVPSPRLRDRRGMELWPGSGGFVELVRCGLGVGVLDGGLAGQQTP
eukprot:6204952-Pleurochrysis_carterae.AAC.2